MSNLDTALLAIARGYFVLPCEASKGPVTALALHGPLSATGDSETARKWWTARPDALVGINPGMSGLTVVDLDAEKVTAAGEVVRSGEESTVLLGLPRATDSHPSVSGMGRHEWYRGTTGSPVGLYDGIDVRSLSAYVVAGHYVEHLPHAADVEDGVPEEYRHDPAAVGERWRQGVEAWVTWLAERDGDAPIASRALDLQARRRAPWQGHDDMVRLQRALVGGAIVDGWAGVPAVLTRLREVWVSSPHGGTSADVDRVKAGREWDVALAGAVAKFGGTAAAQQAAPSEEAREDLEALEHYSTPLPGDSADPFGDDQRAPELTERERNIAERREQIVVNTLAAQEAREELAPSEPLAFVSLGELRRRPPVTWLVDRFVLRDTTAILAGPPGVGKSFVTVDLACAVATGSPFLGERPARAGRVLYIAGEGATGLPARIAAWEEARGIRVPDDALVVAERGVDFSSEARVAELVAAVTGSEFALIVADTLSQLTSLKSENDSAEIAAAIRNAKRVRETSPGSALLFVHHTGKGEGSKVRGSSAIGANVDTVWVAHKVGAAGGESFDLTTNASRDGKMKDAPRETLHGLRLVPVGASAVVEMGPTLLDANAPDPLAALDPGGEYTIAELQQALGLTSRTTAERAASNYVSTGRLVKPSRGRYRLAVPSDPSTEGLTDE